MSISRALLLGKHHRHAPLGGIRGLISTVVVCARRVGDARGLAGQVDLYALACRHAAMAGEELIVGELCRRLVGRSSRGSLVGVGVYSGSRFRMPSLLVCT